MTSCVAGRQAMFSISPRESFLAAPSSRSLISVCVEFLRRVDILRTTILCPLMLKDLELSSSEMSDFDSDIPSDLYECYQLLLHLKQQLEQEPSQPEPEMTLSMHKNLCQRDMSQRSIDSAYHSSSSLDHLDSLSDTSEPDVKPTSFASAVGGSISKLCKCLRVAIQLCSILEKRYVQILS